jgi:hypothetical protein
VQAKKYSRNFFDDILNESIDRIISGEPAGYNILKYPALARSLEPLLRTALSLRMISKIRPAPEFKSSARLEFQAVLRK